MEVKKSDFSKSRKKHLTDHPARLNMLHNGTTLFLTAFSCTKLSGEYF